MPTITVEDGTGVANANSYVDTSYLYTYTNDRGLVLPQNQETQERMLIKAADYLEALRSKFKGTKAVDTQEMQWPRKDVSIDGIDFAKNDIPEELKRAQCQLVIEQEAGVVLYPAPRTSSMEGIVTEKTAGPLTKKFAPMDVGLANANKPVKIMSVWAFLKPLFKCQNAQTSTIRV